MLRRLVPRSFRRRFPRDPYGRLWWARLGFQPDEFLILGFDPRVVQVIENMSDSKTQVPDFPQLASK